MISRLRILTRLLLGFLMVVLAILLPALFSVRTAERYLERSAGHTAAALAEETLDRLDGRFSRAVDDLRMFSMRAVCRKSLAAAPAERAATASEVGLALEESFIPSSEVHHRRKLYEAACLADDGGAVIACAGNRELFTEEVAHSARTPGAGAISFGRVIAPTGTGTLVAPASLRVQDDAGRTLGTVYALLDAADVVGDAVEAERVSAGVRYLVFTGDGRLVYASRDYEHLGDSSEDPELRAAREGEGWLFSEREGRRLLTGYAHDAGAASRGRLDWVVIVKRPAEGVLRPVRPLRVAILLGALVAALLSAGGAFSIARSITRPVRRLGEVATRLTLGDLSERVGPLPLDELGELGAAFDAMAERLQVTREGLRSEVKARTAALAESERRLATLLGNLPGMAYRCRNEPDRPMEFVSEGARSLTGYAPEALQGGGCIRYGDLIHPDDRVEVWERVQAALARADIFQLTYRIRRADGEERRVWEQGGGVARGEGGAPVLEGLVLDVTDRDQVEEELKASQERFRSLVELSPDGIVIRTEGRIAFANPAAARLLGSVDPEELLGESVLKLVDPGDAETVLERIRWTDQEGRGYRVQEQRLILADGGEFTVEISAVPFSQGGKPGALMVLRDVTERTRLEEQLRQAQKLEAIGMLAGGVAHDFNNLLMIILGTSEVALEELPPDAPERRPLEEIQRAGNRAASLTRQLLAFSRCQVLEPKVLDLNALVVEISKMLRRLIGENVELRLDLGSDLERVRADEGQIAQVFLNLALNARDAMPEGGRLVVETANHRGETPGDLREGPNGPGAWVRLTLRDTGSGMDEATRARVFEPFFTTKERGRGTGMGLATVHGIVKQGGGFLTVDTTLGQGSAFHVYLPAVDAPKEPDVTVARMTAGLGGSGTVLVVEDEDPVRELLCVVLSGAGYTVLSAPDG